MERQWIYTSTVPVWLDLQEKSNTLLPHVLIANPVHPGQTEGQHFLLRAAESKADNIAAPATVTACGFIFIFFYIIFLNTKDRESW